MDTTHIEALGIARAIDYLAQKVEVGTLDSQEFLEHVDALWADAREQGISKLVDDILLVMVSAAEAQRVAMDFPALSSKSCSLPN